MPFWKKVDIAIGRSGTQAHMSPVGYPAIFFQRKHSDYKVWMDRRLLFGITRWCER